MKHMKVDLSHLGKEIDYASYEEKVAKINQSIVERTGEGADFLGWENYCETYDKEELIRIEKSARWIRENCEILLVCGIGGSYLGARAAIEAIKGTIRKSTVEIIYFGQTVAPSYVAQVLEYIKDKTFAVNVISKSGTTTETAIGFRLARDILVSRYGVKGASKYIYATTDAEKGALLTLCKKYGYERFVLPADIGGRYSVFTAVGTLPMAVAGIDIKEFIKGNGDCRAEVNTNGLNDCYRYAVARHVLYKDYKYMSEMLVTYEPRFVQLGEWWKQLFGESEGKQLTGLFPASATFTTDLHSLGQFIQEGSKGLFETVLDIKTPTLDIIIPHDDDNLDGLNYLEGKSMDFVCKKAHDGTVAAHAETGGVPNVLLTLDRMDAYHLGYLFYFFFRACAMSCYLNGVNPFNQPGVEIYKKNMFHLLGKPGC